jgi:hypothetical protein
MLARTQCLRDGLLFRDNHVRRHYPALDHDKLAGFVGQLRASQDASPQVKLGLEMLIHASLRVNELNRRTA